MFITIKEKFLNICSFKLFQTLYYTFNYLYLQLKRIKKSSKNLNDDKKESTLKSNKYVASSQRK